MVVAIYTLTPTRSGYTFAQRTRTASVPPDVVGQDLTGVPNAAPGCQGQLTG